MMGCWSGQNLLTWPYFTGSIECRNETILIQWGRAYFVSWSAAATRLFCTYWSSVLVIEQWYFNTCENKNVQVNDSMFAYIYQATISEHILWIQWSCVFWIFFSRYWMKIFLKQIFVYGLWSLIMKNLANFSQVRYKYLKK